MSRWADLDALVRDLVGRIGTPADIQANYAYVCSGLERLCEATDLPSSEWSRDPILPHFGEIGVCGVITAVLRACPDDSRLVSLSSLLARHMSRNDANKAALALAGVIPAVATAMGKQLPVAKTQENFVSVFGNLSYREENKAIIVESGGVNAIASAMEAHSSDETICEIACIALRSLGSAQLAVPAIMSRNALQQVVSALARFPGASDLVVFGVQAVLNVLSRVPAEDASTLVRNLIGWGGIDALYGCVDEQFRDETACANICAALKSLSTFDVATAAVVAHPKSLTTMARLMHATAGTDSFRNVSSVFDLLVARNPLSEETRSVVAACSHAQGVITIMNAAVGDRGLQLWGCQQLMKIGFNGAHRQSIGAQGGIDAIATAMKDFPVDEPLQDAACGALWVLAFHPDNRTKMTELPTVLPALTTCQSKFRGNASVMERCQALFHMLKLS